MAIYRSLLVILSIFVVPLAHSAGWKEIRTGASGKTGWQYVVCQGGSGWNTCELDLNIALTATPNQLVAIGEQSTLKAVVTDAYNNPVEAGVRIGWVTTDGALSATESLTDANGVTSTVLTSSNKLGGATVTARAVDYGGTAALFVPFIDKWIAYPSTFTSWANYGAYYSCTAWSPDTSTVASGTWFTQTASCWQQQQQWRQDRLQSVVTGNIINSGAAVPLYQAITIGISQMNVGTKVVAPICTYDFNNFQWFGIRNLITNSARWELATDGGWTRLFMPKADGFAGQGIVYNGFLYTVGAWRRHSETGAESGVTVDLYEYCKTPL